MSRVSLVILTTVLCWATLAAAETPTDRLGDPLPENAVQRLGSQRLRYGSIGDLAYLPDGRALVASGTNIDVWDMSAGEREARHQVGTRPLSGIDVRDDGTVLLAANVAGTVFEFDLEQGEILREWETEQGRLSSVYYSADEARALTCGTNPPTLKEWDLETGEELVFAESDLHSARQAVYGHDDRSAFIHGAAGSDPVVEHYDLTDGSLIHAFLEDFYTHVRSIALSPDRERLLVGSRTRATEWRVDDGHELLNTFRGHHGGAVTSVAYAPDPEQLLTGSRDGSIRLWNRLPEGGEVINRWLPHSRHVTYIRTSPDGQWVMSYGGGNMVVEYGIEDGQPRLDWERHELGVNAVALTPEGRAISGAADGTVRVWDMLSGRQLLVIDEAEQGAWAVAVSADGERIAAGCKDGVIREFSASDGSLIRELEGHLGYIRAVAYMPEAATDGASISLLSAAGDGTLRAWGPAGEEPLHILEGDLFAEDGHRGGVLATAISTDGTQALSGGRDGTVRLWDLQTGAQQTVLRGHRGWVEAVAFAGDTGQILSASRDGTVRRWDASTGEVITEMDHGSAVMGVACTDDGATVIAGGTDNRITVWDPAGEQIAVLSGHAANVNAVALSLDHAYIVSASDDASLLVWEVPEPEAE